METDPPSMPDELCLPDSSVDPPITQPPTTAERAGPQAERRRSEESSPPPTDPDPLPDKHFEPL